MIVGNIENGLERGFVKRCLNYVLIIDPKSQNPWNSTLAGGKLPC